LSYRLTITVETTPDTPVVPVDLSLGVGGEQHVLPLEPAGNGLFGGFELPTAPRYLRVQGECGDAVKATCLDELVVLHDVGSGQLHYQQVHDHDGPHLVRVGDGAVPLWVSFAWGGTLLLALGLLWWRGGKHASG
jgi:hypothetical protein